jgi:CheY-like chemotaxis protein
MSQEITILAVDDQPQNLRLLEAILSPRGYRVVAASSGEEALERLPSSGADLVLLDIVMPAMDGYEVCRRIRADPETAYLPVVMLTASGDQEKLHAIEAGAETSSPNPSTRASFSPASRRWCESSVTRTPSSARPLSSRPGTESWRTASKPRCRNCNG